LLEHGTGDDQQDAVDGADGETDIFQTKINPPPDAILEELWETLLLETLTADKREPLRAQWHALGATEHQQNSSCDNNPERYHGLTAKQREREIRMDHYMMYLEYSSYLRKAPGKSSKNAGDSPESGGQSSTGAESDDEDACGSGVENFRFSSAERRKLVSNLVNPDDIRIDDDEDFSVGHSRFLDAGFSASGGGGEGGIWTTLQQILTCAKRNPRTVSAPESF
jgi:hypothetical protein